MNKRNPSVSHEAEQIREFRKHPKRAVEYLNACLQVAFEENDPELVLVALALVAKASGMSYIAKETDFHRVSLHRMLSKKGNPEWNSMFKVFKALHLRIKLEPIQSKAA